MPGFFPTPFDDECLYSLCARYSQIVNYPCREKAIAEMFGRKSLSIAIDLPSSLKALIKRIEVKSNFSAQKIIEKHSLLPYYAAFLPQDRVKRLIQLMKSSTGEAVHNLSGITATSVNRPNKLKYCPSCAFEEKKDSGIVFWHRLHQLAGVLVCPEHLCFLENSDADITKNPYKANLFYPEEYISISKPRNINLGNRNHQVLLTIARGSEWLLNTSIKCIGYEQIEKIYMSILNDKDLITLKGQIKLSALRKQFRDYYSSKLLDLLECNFDDNKEYQWFSRIIPHLRMQKVHHPLRHLLFIGMLGHTLDTFFSYSLNQAKKSNSKSKSYFFPPPYPCLNPVCSNYNKPSVDTFEIKSSNKGSYQTLFVSCPCGFSYYRNGPDTKDEDLYRKTSVTNFGKLWEKELAKLWKNETLGIHKITKLLNVNHRTIKRTASILRLQLPRKGPRGAIITVSEKVQKQFRDQHLARENKEEILEEKIKEYRKKWISILAENPFAKRSDLSEEIAPSIARFLSVYDHEWFYTNQPKAWKRTESARQIDWKIRDSECADKVRQIAVAIKAQEGKPIWVKPSVIAQEFEHRDWVTNSKYLKKMPLTYEVLKAVTETRIDYNVRRINWAVNCIKEDGGSFAVSFIGQRAVVAWYLWKVPEIQQAIEAGIEEIKKHRGLIWNK